MNCLFCKIDTEHSKGVEHIIPESLGNKDHLLPKGLVCDSCNQYFALKVEKPLLELPYFKNVRHRARIESKRGKIPVEKAILWGPKPAKAEIQIDKNGEMHVYCDEEQAAEIFSKPKGSMIIQIIPEPDKDCKVVSRFLAKVAVEALLFKLLSEEGWIDEIMNKPELEEIKNYARYGTGIKFWPYHQRRIYSEETRFNHPNVSIKDYEVLHEFEILLTPESHCYFVMAIMGIEYAISLGGPGIDSYEKWLLDNNNHSVLDEPGRSRVIPDENSISGKKGGLPPFLLNKRC